MCNTRKRYLASAIVTADLLAPATTAHHAGPPRAITDTASAKYIYGKCGSIKAVADHFGVSWKAAYRAVHDCPPPWQVREEQREAAARVLARATGNLAVRTYQKRLSDRRLAAGRAGNVTITINL